MSTQRSTDAPQNLEELRRMAIRKEWGSQVPDYYMEKIDRRWRTLGRLAKDPTALMGADKY